MAKDNNITMLMYSKYVDDINIIIRALGLGVKWDGRKMTWTQEAEDQDRLEALPDDERTMTEIAKISNIILPYLNLVPDYCSNHQTNQLPVLDIRIWQEVREGKTNVRYGYYEKPCSSDKVMMEQITDYLKKHNLIHPNQHGNQKGKSVRNLIS